MRLRLRHPAVGIAVTAAFVVGAFGGLVPGGILAESAGAGLGRGATWGAWAYVATAPLLVVASAATLIAARYDRALDRDLFLAGLPDRSTLPHDGLAAALLAVVELLAAVSGGALAGLGDALAQGGALLTEISATSLVVALASALGWTVGALTAVAVLRSALRATLALGGAAVASLSVLNAVRTEQAWDVLAASPLAAFVLATRAVFGEGRGFSTPTTVAALAAVAWLVVAAALAAWSVRRPRPPVSAVERQS